MSVGSLPLQYCNSSDLFSLHFFPKLLFLSNSGLIIAVKDNFHFLLKLMYKKNKYQRNKIEELESTITQQQVSFERLRRDSFDSKY